MEFLKKIRIDLIILYLFISIPLWIWISMIPLSQRFATSAMTLTSLGQLTGLLGMTLVGLSMFFQVRLVFLNKFFLKPGTVNKLHHYFGIYGFILLLIHPIVLAIKYIPISMSTAAKFLIGYNWVNLVGLFALVGMFLSLYITIFVDRSFRYWKLFHQLMLIVYILIILHLLFTISDISNNTTLYAYIMGVTLAGGIAFLVQKGIYYYMKWGFGV